MSDEQRIEIPANGERPPLMIFLDRRLSCDSLAHLRESIDSYYETGKCSIFEPGFKVFQCVGGVWVEINPKPVEAEVGKVNFREFT